MKPPIRLSEDWLATIIGLLLVLLIAVTAITIPYPLFNLLAP
ncbi:hypothetical protein [Candidatus Flexifilum breve]|jgi:hypothetical protein